MAPTIAFTLLLLASLSLTIAQHTTCTNTTTARDTIVGDLSFTSEPRGRGTWGILFSCSATFGFCVWTAVHPNIIVDASPWYRFFYKAILMLVSIIVPEGVILCSFGQWKLARKLHIEWQEKFPDNKDYLGMDGAFFVVMGGFVIDRALHANVAQDETAQDNSRSEKTRLQMLASARRGKQDEDYTATLTPAGFLYYLENNRIDHKKFKKQDIVDKGKASNIAKLLSSFQALWLFVQCLGRWRAKLPLTLLEIHVLIQVGCTLIIYACWWNKPLDINEPITIDILKPITPGLTTSDTLPLQGKTVKELELEEEGKNALRPMNRQYITKRCPPNLISITAKACYDIIVYIDPKDEGGLSKTNPTINDKDETQITTSDKNKRTIKKIKKTLPMVAEGLIVGFIGLLHAAAWNVHFPTELERWLWRISSIGMCIFPTAVVFIATCTWYQQDLTDTIWEVHLLRFNVATFVLAALYKIHDVAKKHSLKSSGAGVSFVRYAAHMVLILVCLGSLLAYAICIIFITVESYISVRDPPDRSMITPLWSNYWPHL